MIFSRTALSSHSAGWDGKWSIRTCDICPAYLTKVVPVLPDVYDSLLIMYDPIWYHACSLHIIGDELTRYLGSEYISQI
jgi:hypothetical protein